MSHSFYCHGTSAARGVAIMINLKESFEIIQINNLDTFSNHNGRLLGVCIKYKNQKIGLVNCYAPNVNNSRQVRDEYLQFLTEVDQLLDLMTGQCDNIILGGDFNLILDLDLDAKGGNPYLYEDCLTSLKDMCERHDLLDLFRTKYPTEVMHTFAPGGKNIRHIFRRLDYFWVSSQIVKQCIDLETTKLINTDHCALSFSF